MKTKTAIWFSRHQPTADQLADAERLGFTLTGIEAGQALGSREIHSRDDARALVADIRALAAHHRASAVFGVWSADLLHLMATRLRECRSLPCYAAANSRRSVEGQAPTFSHREWLFIGHLGERAEV